MPVTNRALLLLVAVVLFVITALGALDVFTWNHYMSLGWFGLAALAAASVVP